MGLIRSRRFGPIFLTQFMGAFNDNVFKNALILLLAFQTGELLGLEPAAQVQVAAGLFVLPFFLFSAVAGQLADKFEKTRLIRLVKLAEIGIALIAAAGFATRHIELLLGALFLMGLHSTFFGPLKYSILPQHLHADELVAGNAWVESGTFVAILLGSVLAGLLMATGHRGPLLAGTCCVVVAVAGYLASRAIPLAPAPVPDLSVRINPLAATCDNLRMVRGNRTVFLSLIGISWFWFYGALFLSQFAPYVSSVLAGDELLVTCLLSTFIVGIAAGSFLCERLSGRHVEVGLVPLGSIGLTLFGVDLWWNSPGVPAPYAGVATFFFDAANWRLLFDLVMIGVSGGFYTVPLYALIQARSEPAQRSRVIAANNIVNAAFMVASAVFGLVMLQSGMTIPQLFLVTALMNAGVAICIYRLVPEFLLRLLAWMLVHTTYRLRVRGQENLPDTGAAVLICNHVSYVDALVIAAACRRPVRFVMDHAIYRMPILRYAFRDNRAIPIASGSDAPALLRAAYDEIAAALAAGELVCVFPEGHITRNGEIGAFRNGIGRIVARTPVPVVPMALRGLWGSFFSYKGGRTMRWPLRRGVLNRIELVVGTAVPAEHVTVRHLRERVRALRGDGA